MAKRSQPLNPTLFSVPVGCRIREVLLYYNEDIHTLYTLHYMGNYHIAGNFSEVYISPCSRFDQIHESLSREFANITIQTYNTRMQIAKFIP